ncbi:MAG: PHP domain-containing protein [Nocardioidaceae bacterium]
MLIDLHAHSSRSDGTDLPAELVALAADAGLDVLALTDHDSADGWDEARAAAEAYEIVLLPGLEISCRHLGAGAHLLAYLPDPRFPPLAEELVRVLDGRNGRLPAILARLHRVGVELDVADIRRVAGAATATGRPHVADALVARGVVSNRDEAFDRFLSPGRPAYVDRYAAELTEMVALVARAGGVSVLAHPWGRGSRRVLTPQVLAELAEAGLAGIEVDHNDHSAEQRAALRAIASETGLVATGSSDYHGTGKVGHPLACNTTSPDQLGRLLDRADASAQAARQAGAEPPRAPGVAGVNT